MTQIVYQQEEGYYPEWQDSLHNYVETDLDGGVVVKAPLFKPNFDIKRADYITQKIAEIDDYDKLDEAQKGQIRMKLMREYRNIPKTIERHNKYVAGRYRLYLPDDNNVNHAFTDWKKDKSTVVSKFNTHQKNVQKKKDQVKYKGKTYKNQKEVDEKIQIDTWGTELSETFQKLDKNPSTFNNTKRKNYEEIKNFVTEYGYSEKLKKPPKYDATQETAIYNEFENYNTVYYSKHPSEYNEFALTLLVGEDGMVRDMPQKLIDALEYVNENMKKSKSYLTNKKLQQTVANAEKHIKDLNSEAYKNIHKHLREEEERKNNRGVGEWIRDNIWRGDKIQNNIETEKLLDSQIVSSNTNANGVKKETIINNRPVNDVRVFVNNDQETLDYIFYDKSNSETRGHGASVWTEKIAIPLFEDLKKEYMLENGSFDARMFKGWLYNHEDEKYSGVDRDDEEWSYVEIFENSKLIDDVPFGNELAGVLSINNMSEDDFESEKLARGSYDSEQTKYGYNKAGFHSHLAKNKPDVLIKYIQASRKARGDNELGNILNRNQELQIIEVLDKEYGEVDPNGTPWDWYTLEPFWYPQPSNLK
tara:strand:- start:1455 stop:3218 length:1764 start_codon:yes stop_codon:yes gene_type:complete